MYYNAIYDDFSAAHRLRGYEGSCEELHGHNFKVKVVICGSELNDIGILHDFRDSKSILAEILEELDHKVLNELEYFKEHNPTAELISRYIYDTFTESLSDNENLRVYEVTVWESDTNEATYRP